MVREAAGRYLSSHGRRQHRTERASFLRNRERHHQWLAVRHQRCRPGLLGGRAVHACPERHFTPGPRGSQGRCSHGIAPKVSRWLGGVSCCPEDGRTMFSVRCFRYATVAGRPGRKVEAFEDLADGIGRVNRTKDKQTEGTLSNRANFCSIGVDTKKSRRTDGESKGQIGDSRHSAQTQRTESRHVQWIDCVRTERHIN